MKTIHYAGEILMTGDAIADAIVQYAEALAQHETSAAIDVPVITEGGVAADASFLLGPASQLIAVPLSSDFPDPVDEELLARITLAITKLTGMPVTPTDVAEDSSPSEYDF